ncbi:MAG: DUF748 domain-containing protein, partial [Desulfobulbaceae bacterium]|nr:DUF748 domain-containing protein [Desulfobulbaceae bacterium]
MADNIFGDIRIHPGTPEEAKEEDLPLSGNSEAYRKEPAVEQQFTAAAADKTAPDYRRKSRARRGRPPVFSRRTMAWFSVIPLLVVFYGVGSYFLVPIFINGVLVSNFSREIQRPVETGRVVFSPYTLELFVDHVTIGAVYGDTTGGQLLAAEKARFAFSLARILDGKVVCRQAALEGISVDLIRRPEATFDLKRVADLFLYRLPGHDVRYWPAWLLLDELEITSGRIRIDDRPAKKIYSIENIRFYLPSSDTRDRDDAAMPKLTASLDSSPFEINAVRFRNQAGAWRTGFSFAFNSLLLNNFKELFPLPDTGLQLSDGEADINLNVILPERDVGLQSIVVEGEAELRNARWQDHDAQAELLLPQAKIVYRVVPADKLFTLTSVEFHEPEISLTGKDAPAAGKLPASLTYPLSVLDTLSRAQESLKVEHFLWDNGKISHTINGAVQHETVYNDVVFSIKGFS